MTQGYQFFISYWRECLSDYENIFSSINTYSIIKYLKEYWNTGKNKKKTRGIQGFEKDLVSRLVNIIECSEPDIRIIKELDSNIAKQFETTIKSISNNNNNNLDENSIKILDEVIRICKSEQFKKEIFNRIFTSSQLESVYLIPCILRILVEEHSREFLDTLPAKVFA